MRCRHCFAGFADAGHENLPRAAMLAVVRELAAGFERINFVGGEPTLCPWLVEGLHLAHSLGRATSIVTNGTRLLTHPDLRDSILTHVEWLGLSVDSGDPTTNRAIGRAFGQSIITPNELAHLADRVRRAGVALKINTVVQRANLAEDLGPLLARLRPDRWKVLQVLPVEGQNDDDYREIAIADAEFQQFVDRHRWLESAGITIVPEDHTAMTGSYAMVDPGGYAFDNIDGRHRYSHGPVHEIGWREAFTQVRLLPERFLARGGNHSVDGARR